MTIVGRAVGHAVDAGGTVAIWRAGRGGSRDVGDIDWLIAAGGGAAMTDAEFSPEIGVGRTAVGMVGAEEYGNAMARLFILMVTSNRRRGHE